MGTHIGQHITELRKIRRLSVRQLATRINVSVSSLEKYERGSRTVPSGLIAKLAQALAVGPERITGQPYLNGVESDEQIQAVIPDLRRIMITYDNPDAPTRAPRPLATLATEAESVARLRQDGQYVAMGPLLPGLLTELTQVALSARGAEQQRAFWWLARCYRV